MKKNDLLKIFTFPDIKHVSAQDNVDFFTILSFIHAKYFLKGKKS